MFQTVRGTSQRTQFAAYGQRRVNAALLVRKMSVWIEAENFIVVDNDTGEIITVERTFEEILEFLQHLIIKLESPIQWNLNIRYLTERLEVKA